MGGLELSPPRKGVPRYASPSKVRAPHVPKVPVCVRESLPTYSSDVFKAGPQPATTHRPFLVRSTHPSSDGLCDPGRGVGASRVYPLDVGKNSVPPRVTINHTYIKAG